MVEVGSVVYVFGYNVIGTVESREGDTFQISLYGQEPLHLQGWQFRPAKVEDFEWAGWYKDEENETIEE